MARAATVHIACRLRTHVYPPTSPRSITGVRPSPTTPQARLRELLGHAIFRASLPADADAVTAAGFGGFEIAMMAGAFLGGAERGATC